MGYGGFGTGSGASTYDLDRLAAGVISGHVSAPLTAADGMKIATRSGEEIVAYISRVNPQKTDAALSSAVAGIVRVIETDRAEYNSERYNLAADIIRGTVSAPLTTASGFPIQDRGGNLLFAYRVRDDGRAYADRAIAQAFGELSATVERYQAQNMAAIQSLIAGIISGQFSVPLTNVAGTVITADNGVSLAAVKNL